MTRARAKIITLVTTAKWRQRSVDRTQLIRAVVGNPNVDMTEALRTRRPLLRVLSAKHRSIACAFSRPVRIP